MSSLPEDLEGKKEVKRVEFEGIPSGDYECFCWAVDRETYVRIKGEEPREFDENTPFYPGLFKLYPSDLFDDPDFDRKTMGPTKWAFESEELKVAPILN